MTIETFEPTGDRILVRRHELTEKKGSLYIPDNAKEQATEGTVLAVGPGAMSTAGELIPMFLQVGDEILFGKYNGAVMQIGGVEVILMRENEVMGRTARAPEAKTGWDRTPDDNLVRAGQAREFRE